ncbi:GNAT family N-acetyltransferase [Dactylosporangium sp. NPDC000555]|uniref:GNAT family N-acetyltransferase n=1 Tax=Dactylosporangium sp. NPDC000555 TaxID=3154260 RepID=UPI0033322F23
MSTSRPGPDPTPDSDVLDAPVWAALHGPHRRFAEVIGKAARFPTDVSPFHALAPDAGPEAWPDLAKLTGPGAEAALTGDLPPPPPGWTMLRQLGGVQLVDVALEAAPDPDAVVLTAADVPEMLDLVARTRPGPFLPRTIELGTYLGLRHEGALIAMAGERLHPPGWTEISAVCTDPAFRGRGLATRLVRAVAAVIRARGERAFLHTSAANTNAIRLYESIGFELRKRTTFTSFVSPP